MTKNKSRELVTYTRGYIDRLKWRVDSMESSANYWLGQADTLRRQRDALQAEVENAKAGLSKLEQMAHSAIRQRDEAQKHSERISRQLVAMVYLVGESVGLEVTA